MAFDYDSLQAVDTRIKDELDDFISNGICSCDSEDKKFVNTLIIIREGITIDLLLGDEDAATAKVALLNDTIDAGPSANCDC